MKRDSKARFAWSLLIVGYGLITSGGPLLGITPERSLATEQAAVAPWAKSSQAERAASDVQLRCLKRMFSNQEMRADQFYEKVQSLLSKRK